MVGGSISNKQIFFKKLNHGPSILFLGQNSKKLHDGHDIFLEEICSKYSELDNNDCKSYFQLLEMFSNENVDDALMWIHKLSQNLTIPKWLEEVSKFNWSSVYTSTIDSSLLKAFRSEWRKVSPIYSPIVNPIDLNSRKNLHCTFLFGSFINSSIDQIPPLNNDEYEDRLDEESHDLLKRIRSTITSIGTLVIEGYDPNNDWLNSSILKREIKKLIKGQTFLFNASEKVRNNPEISFLIKEGKIIAFDEPLNVVLKEGIESGAINSFIKPLDDEFDCYIDIDERSYNLPASIWRKVSQFAEILDSNTYIEPEKIDIFELEVEFRNFLANSSRYPIWPAYSRDFAFTRDYEHELSSIIKSKLKSRTIEDYPVILHGQTGSGKTITLQNLAFKFGKTHYPVIYIKGVPYSYDKFGSPLDEFCEWAENNGANKTLIIWDGMVSPSKYQSLFNFLSNRGRKVVLVGSYYNIDPDEISQHSNSNFKFVNAKVNLDDIEITRLKQHFSKFYPNFNDIYLKNLDYFSKDNFLVFLYRLLPDSRSLIQEGIHTEANYAEGVIRDGAIKHKINFGNQYFKIALKNAGINLSENSDSDFKIESLNDSEVFSELLQYVMIPGRLGLSVPYDLIQRTIKSSNYLELLEILEKIDLFIVSEENDGNIFISSRHTLEAKLLCNFRFGGPEEEIKHSLKLIKNIKVLGLNKGYLDDEDIELRFLLEFIKGLGPNGPEKSRYKKYYYVISKTLDYIRKEHSIQYPPLILQQANLAREHVKANPEEISVMENGIIILDGAIELLEKTIFDLLAKNYSNDNLIDQMRVELAATRSTRIIQLLKNNSNADIAENCNKIHDDLDKVLKKTVNDEHALDIYGWSCNQIIKRDNSSLTEIEKVEILTRSIQAIEIGETGAFGINDVILDRKRESLALLGETKLSEEIFDSLKKRGSCIGYLRSSIERTSKIPNNIRILDKDQIKLCSDNFDFLNKDRDFIKNNLGCLHQLLKSWWMMKTHKPIFNKENERQALAFNLDDWKYCLNILVDMNECGGLENNPSMVYLFGLTKFHLGNYLDSIKAFNSISHLDFSYGGGGGRRIIKYYLASSESGLPIEYNGRIVALNNETNYGLIEVEELRKKIRFFPKEYRDEKLKEGYQMEPFHIAFNFINIVADPIRYYKKN